MVAGRCLFFVFTFVVADSSRPPYNLPSPLNNIRRGDRQSLLQGRQGQLHLGAHAPGREEDGVIIRRRLVDIGGGTAFSSQWASSRRAHSRCGAAALFGAAFLPSFSPQARAAFFQIQFFCHRHYKHKEAAAFAPGHQGLKHSVRFLAQQPSHLHAVHGRIVVGIVVIGQLFCCPAPALHWFSVLFLPSSVTFLIFIMHFLRKAKEVLQHHLDGNRPARRCCSCGQTPGAGRSRSASHPAAPPGR